MSFDDDSNKIWQALWAAYQATHAAAQNFVQFSTYRKPPRQKIPTIELNEHGWPRVETNEILLKSRADDPVDWRTFVTYNSNGWNSICVNEVPSIREPLQLLVDMSETSSLCDSLINIRPGFRSMRDIESVVLRGGSLSLLKALLEGDEVGQPKTVLHVYKEYRSIISDHTQIRVPVSIWAPLLLTDAEVTEKFELTNKISIRPIPKEINIKRAKSASYSTGISKFLHDAANYALVIEGKALNTRFYPTLDPMFDYADAHEVFDILPAISIITGSQVGVPEILAIPDGWNCNWNSRRLGILKFNTPEQVPVNFEGGWNRPPITRLTAKTLSELRIATVNLMSAPSNIALAARRVRTGSLRSSYEDRLMDATIGFEALLGNDRTELSHRLSQRAAVLLAKEIDPVITYNATKAIYTARSKVAHGSEIKGWGFRFPGEKTEYDLVKTAEDLLRRLLSENLLNGIRTPQELDSEILRRIDLRPDEASRDPAP